MYTFPMLSFIGFFGENILPCQGLFRLLRIIYGFYNLFGDIRRSQGWRGRQNCLVGYQSKQDRRESKGLTKNLI